MVSFSFAFQFFPSHFLGQNLQCLRRDLGRKRIGRISRFCLPGVGISMPTRNQQRGQLPSRYFTMIRFSTRVITNHRRFQFDNLPRKSLEHRTSIRQKTDRSAAKGRVLGVWLWRNFEVALAIRRGRASTPHGSQITVRLQHSPNDLQVSSLTENGIHMYTCINIVYVAVFNHDNWEPLPLLCTVDSY